MKPVIWYCNHYSPVSEELAHSRGPILMEHLAKLGFDPFIITANYDHINGHKSFVPQPAKMIRGVGYYLIDTPSYRGNGIQRIRNMLAYGKGIRRELHALVAFTGKPDAIIVSSAHMFHFKILKRIAKKYQAKLIFEVRDLWPLSLIEILKIKPYHPFILWLKYIEKRAYKNADMIISLLSNAYLHFKKFAVPPEKVKWISNGAALIASHKQDLTFFNTLDTITPKARLIIGYAGAHGFPNALEQLIAALKIVNSRGYQDIYAVLVGDGNCKAALMQQAADCPNILFLDPIDKTLMPDFLKRVDVIFIGSKKTELYKYGVSPNKLYESMLYKKPIIKTFTTDDVLPYEHFCFSAAAEQPEGLADLIIDIALHKKPLLNSMGERALELAEAHFTWEKLAEKYQSALNSLLSNPEEQP